MGKTALITGITGQDGSYLAELLLAKGYDVHGIKRRASMLNTQRIDHIYEDPHEPDPRLHLHYGDLTDSSNLTRIVGDVKPDEIYNLGAQSHVAVSFEQPEYTADVDALGTLRLLESVRLLGLTDRCASTRPRRASSTGWSRRLRRRETTPFYPRSPYAVAKLYAYWITVNYRESYGMYACNGILFNHESPRRGETFVTRKITRGLAQIALGLESCLYLGNMDALRDWGHAKDYVVLQWMMLQQDEPEDYVIATGEQHSVRDFVRWTAEALGVTLRFEGTGVEEMGVVESVEGDLAPPWRPGDVVVRVDPRYFRPAEVETLLGDPRKAADLGWKPTVGVREMVREMVEHDHDGATPRPAQAARVRRAREPGRHDDHQARLRGRPPGHGGLGHRAPARAADDVELVTADPGRARPPRPARGHRLLRAHALDEVYLAAAKVGGIQANNTYPADFIWENLMIEANVIKAAHDADVDRLLFLGSSCIYPRNAPQPMSEDTLLTGVLEPTNEPYAVAKIAGIKLCESFNRQYGRDYRSVMPTNLYGPRRQLPPREQPRAAGADPPLRRGRARRQPRRSWSGGAAAAARVPARRRHGGRLGARHGARPGDLRRNTEPMLSHINVGTGSDCSIRELAELVASVTGFRGRITFDTSKPDGTPRKLLDVSRLSAPGVDRAIPLDRGSPSLPWFREHEGTFRGR